MKKFRDMEVFPSEQQGREYIKALRLRSYSLTHAAPCWGGDVISWK